MREKILQLRKEGKNVNQIAEILKCSCGLVYYYTSPNAREKEMRRALIYRYNKRKKYKMLAGGKCQRCGYNKCFDALCFHHLNQHEKQFALGTAMMNCVSDKRIKEEIKKCILLCSNCHFELHFNEQDYHFV